MKNGIDIYWGNRTNFTLVPSGIYSWTKICIVVQLNKNMHSCAVACIHAAMHALIYFLWAIKLVAVDFEKFLQSQRRAKLIKRGFIWSIGYSHVISPLLRCDTIAETGAIAVSVILVNITKCKNMQKVGKLPLRTEVKKNLGNRTCSWIATTVCSECY